LAVGVRHNVVAAGEQKCVDGTTAAECSEDVVAVGKQN